MPHVIVGTAGHVDHGKTELTKRLTGIDTDRLPEEKSRGMTIELGFASLVLPNGVTLGLVDVPGHERFVRNMIAGAAGIDIAMLVVAADEGVMPQTREHLAIIDLLGVSEGVIVITKSDLADEEWLDLVREDIRKLVAKSSLKDAEIVACSARTGKGIDKLLETLTLLASRARQRPEEGYARMPVDRVFSKPGFGTIVTGTIWTGKFRTADSVQIWPSGKLARIRAIQIHGEPAAEAVAGTRTAVNLASVGTEESIRGSWIATPDVLRETSVLDAQLTLLESAKPLAQRTRVHVHHGTMEVLARVNLLDRDLLEPGEHCFCQLALESPIPPLYADRLILRSYSPVAVIGGAIVIDPAPGRHKRFRTEVIASLQEKASGDPRAIVADAVRSAGKPVNVSAIAKSAQKPADEIGKIVTRMEREGGLFCLLVDGERQYLLPQQAEKMRGNLQKTLADYHGKYPLRFGMPAAEVRSRLFPGFSPKQFGALTALWQENGMIGGGGTELSQLGFVPVPTPRQTAWIETLTKLYRADGWNPRGWTDAVSALGIGAVEAAELLRYLCETRVLVVWQETVFSKDAILDAAERMKAAFGAGRFSPAEVRDLLSSTRKSVLPLLEYMDDAKLTKRIEGERMMIE